MAGNHEYYGGAMPKLTERPRPPSTPLWSWTSLTVSGRRCCEDPCGGRHAVRHGDRVTLSRSYSKREHPMHLFSRRVLLKLLAANPMLIAGVGKRTPPSYAVKDGSIKIHCTDGYPKLWRAVYQESLEHFAGRWGRVGPLHVFLIENSDWKREEGADKKDPQRLENSQKELKRLFSKLQGDNSNGEHLDWKTGNHWAGWSTQPANLMITMTMSPYRDPEQFVIGPIHEYFHAYQTAYGYAPEAIQGNQMGQSRWTGPAWWREGSAVLVAALHSYQHPKLFKRLKKPYSWEAFRREMNRNLKVYGESATTIRKGVTYDDWNRLERDELVHPVIYAGGSVASTLLLKKAGSLQRFMEFFPLVPELGWKEAFEKHFKITLEEFYKAFDRFARTAMDQLESEPPKGSWCGFLKSTE